MPSEPTRRPVPVVMSIPEQLFRLGPLEFDGDVCRGTMTTGLWLGGPDAAAGTGHAGTLGVLVDDVLGYAINAASGSWSVSTELALDLVGRVPVDGSVLHAEARVVHADASGALAEGTVRTEDGQVIAHCRERGRWVAAMPLEDLIASGTVTHTESLDADDLGTLLGPSVTGSPPTLDLVAAPRLANPLGNLHGGVSLCLSEWLAARVAPAPATTASIHTWFVRGVPPDAHLTVAATVVHPGRSLAVVQVVTSTTTGKPCTLTTVTRH